MELDGLWNLRDLATVGLRPGELLRSDSPHRLDQAGWERLRALGLRRVIDLRTTEEAGRAVVHTPLRYVSVPLEEGLQSGPMSPWFQDGRIATPLYYPLFTERWPERVEAALEAVVDGEGGVLVHCSKGCDRTGMVVALVLEALGVAREAIVGDYLKTEANLAGEPARALGIRDDNAAIAAVLEREGTTLAGALCAYLDGAQGLVGRHRERLRRRFG